MRRRQPLAAVLAAPLALALVTSGCSLQTIGAPRGDLTLTATFDDVQSLVVGHSVQISDIRVGTVTAIGLTGYRSKVTMSLRDDRRIPTGTTATIAKTSLLGENYVRLDPPPGRDLRTGPFLASGAAIGQTSVQPDLEQISRQLSPLLAALGGQDLATITGESATALGGEGDRLNTLIKKASAVSDSYAAASRDLGRTLDGLARIGASLHAGRQQIDRLPGAITVATKRLQDDRAQLKRVVEQLLELARSVNARIQGRHAARLATLLQRADTMLAAAVRGSQDLKALANAVLAFLRGPSVSHSGQALLFLWIKGFLPPPETAAQATQRRPWTELMGPRS
ncbi:virulence factor Mce [Actinomadura craniellae]|uniref:Virulence factor Mce n=1 Tax=Actinomadura craniellae TaxID=2231787 RepID=A0A365GZZ7_9ACTN|nr:MlaD family protein [Actinomadura craniellae]RAY12391.1 virulence factor Mce [Actinomadura craniellae]